MINLCTQKLIAEVFRESERPDKIKVELHLESRTVTITYEDIDDEWFNEFVEYRNEVPFENYDSKTCVNCKYYDSTNERLRGDKIIIGHLCALGIGDISHDGVAWVTPDFGCNKWTSLNKQ